MSKELIRKMVGENIRKERTSRNLSIEELAELTGRTPGFIGLVERGKRGATAELLTKLSEIFEISSDILLRAYVRPSLQVSETHRVKSESKGKRATINSLLYDLQEDELDFVISVVKNMKKMQGRSVKNDLQKKGSKKAKPDKEE